MPTQILQFISSRGYSNNSRVQLLVSCVVNDNITPVYIIIGVVVTDRKCEPWKWMRDEKSRGITNNSIGLKVKQDNQICNQPKIFMSILQYLEFQTTNLNYQSQICLVGIYSHFGIYCAARILQESEVKVMKLRERMK